jgi:acetyl esterase/lipase
MESEIVEHTRNATPGLGDIQRWLSLHGYGWFASALFRAATPPARMRRRFERFGAVPRAAMQRRHAELAFGDHALGQLKMESVRAVPTPRCVMLHLHGGAFIMGSPASYRNRAMRLSYRCNAEVFVPDYRLAPEHPFPAALDDALVAFQYVRALRPHAPLIVSGDSAGGGLALSLMLRLRELGANLPDGAVLLSPWTDLSGSGASVERNRRKDLWLTHAHLQQWARAYAKNEDLRSPCVSPVFADLSGLPPLLLLVGEDEILLDDALRVAAAAARTGTTTAQVHVGKGMQHDWPFTLPWLAESRLAWQVIGRFAAQLSQLASPSAHPPRKESTMSHATQHVIDPGRYAKCVEVSKRIRWDIDRDVIRRRDFDFGKKFLPDGLSKVARLPFLSRGEQRLYSQLQGRTYANMFALVERFIGAKVLEISRGHWLGDQVALEALVRMTEEELKHQELFRRLEAMTARGMPAGYRFLPQPNDMAQAVLAAPTWSVLALTCDIELFSQAHYRSSIEPDAELDPLWKDVFLFHWKEESQHAVLDEMEWMREDQRIGAAERDEAVDALIGLVGAVDGICQVQAQADAAYFVQVAGRAFDDAQVRAIQTTTLAAYRWQYIVSGVQDARFLEILGSMIDTGQGARINAALAPIIGAAH